VKGQEFESPSSFDNVVHEWAIPESFANRVSRYDKQCVILPCHRPSVQGRGMVANWASKGKLNL
jgi:hypothetical protein